METTKKYTVITGASSGIGRETAKAFAGRGKNLIVAARRTENLEALKREILEQHPTLDIVIRTVDLSVLENVYQFYSSLKDFQLETWVNNAGLGNYDSVAQQDLEKINTMLRLNVEALTILSSLFVRDYKDASGTQLINLSSCGGYTIVPTAVTYCATKFYVSTFTEGLAWELIETGAKMRAKLSRLEVMLPHCVGHSEPIVSRVLPGPVERSCIPPHQLSPPLVFCSTH